MTTHFNGSKAKELYYDGSKIKEAWYNGEKVYSGQKPIKLYGYQPSGITHQWYMVGGLTMEDTFCSAASSGGVPSAIILDISGGLGVSSSKITIKKLYRVNATEYTYYTTKRYDDINVYIYTASNITSAGYTQYYWIFVQENSTIGDTVAIYKYGVPDDYNQGLAFFMQPSSVSETTLVTRNSRNRLDTQSKIDRDFLWTRSGMTLVS